MQKILLAMNAECLNSSSIEFACYIAGKTRSSLTAILLEQAEKAALVLNEPEWDDINGATHHQLQGNDIVIDTNRKLLEQACRQRNIPCTTRIDRGQAVDMIVKESRFADLVITDVGTSFGDTESEGVPSRFVKELLANAECPVIISPFEFEDLDEVVFAYDGSESSVFAIKQFAYLLPEFEEVKFTLIQIRQENGKDITEQEKLKEWLSVHFAAVDIQLLQGEAENIFFSKYLTQKNKLLVMGAYGRKFFFDHSTADIVLKTLDMPVFVAHM